MELKKQDIHYTRRDIVVINDRSDLAHVHKRAGDHVQHVWYNWIVNWA